MTVLRAVIYSIIISVSISSAQAQTADWFDAPERGFTSWKPAVKWENGLLSGNGDMGALVLGNPHEETIILSQAQLYLPQDRSDSLFNQAEKLDEIRNLINQGKYEEAAKIPVNLREKAGYTDQRDPFIPAFDIKITQEAANITHYLRATDFETGEAKTIWKDDIGTFQRKLFVSRADSVIVLSIKSDHPINCSVRFQHRPVEWNQWSYINENVESMDAGASDLWLTYRSQFKKKYPGSLEGYEGVGRLILKGGSAEVNRQTLEVSQANEVMLLVKIAPNFHYEHSLVPALKERLSAINLSYDQLLEKHTAIHQKIFDRVRLNLMGEDANRKLHSEEMLLEARQKGPSPALIEKVFDAGRYNILSSTGINPPNLQGIWSGTWTAPWASGFTQDGNLPVAMASVMSGNMPELMQAYVDLQYGFLEDYRENAEKLFGTRGINVSAQTTTSGWPTDFGQTWCLTFWTGAAGWAADIMYNYYLYTLDKAYLKKYAYPWLKQTAWFYEDFLYENESGKLVFNPSYSPENNPSNSTSQAAINATMDVMIAKQVLRHATAAGKLLNEDKVQINKWETMLKKMPAYQVNDDEVLREWLSGGLEDNYEHRHASQLYSLYNYVDQDIINNPKLRQGAINLIDKKLAFRKNEGGGEMAFGLVQLGLSAAHLGEAERAYQTVKWLSSKYWSTGFGSFHNVGDLLNTDISGGLPAVIIEMLVYSEKGVISVLPALPNAWKRGDIEGVLLRNKITLAELKWTENEINVLLHTSMKQEVNVHLPEGVTAAYIEKEGRSIVLTISNNSVKIMLPAAAEVSLRFERK